MQVPHERSSTVGDALRRCSWASSSAWRWRRACAQPPWSWRLGCSSEVVGEILEPAAVEPVEAPLLAADDENERALAPADERHERREVEELFRTRISSGTTSVNGSVRQTLSRPAQKMARPCAPVALELGVEVAADALEVLAEGEPLLVRELPRFPDRFLDAPSRSELRRVCASPVVAK